VWYILCKNVSLDTNRIECINTRIIDTMTTCFNLYVKTVLGQSLQVVNFFESHTDTLATLVVVLILIIVTYSGVYLGNVKFFYMY